MIYNSETYAKHRLKQSYESINDADILLKNGSSSGAIELGLRAARFAAEAALVKDGNDSVRADSLLFLTAGFVKDGRLSPALYNAFRTIMDLSIYASESDLPILNRAEAGAAIENVKIFLKEMSVIVKKPGPK